MTKTEANAIVENLAKLFAGQINGDQAKAYAAELETFSVAAAQRAVREHRNAHEWHNWPQLLEGCRAAEHSAFARRTDPTFRRVVDYVRSEGGVKYHGTSNADVLNIHFQLCWDHVKHSEAPLKGKQVARAYILAHATQAFREILMDEAGCVAWARNCVELAEGERIAPQKVIKEVPPVTYAKAAEQIERLAVVEFGDAPQPVPA